LLFVPECFGFFEGRTAAKNTFQHLIAAFFARIQLIYRGALARTFRRSATANSFCAWRANAIGSAARMLCEKAGITVVRTGNQHTDMSDRGRTRSKRKFKDCSTNSWTPTALSRRSKRKCWYRPSRARTHFTGGRRHKRLGGSGGQNRSTPVIRSQLIYVAASQPTAPVLLGSTATTVSST
jgi:hypothetical protein